MQAFDFLVFLLVAAIGVQSTPFFMKRSSSECQELVLKCLNPAIERYIGKDESEVLEEIRNTAVRAHCNDWNTAVGCIRQVVYTDTCDEIGLKDHELDEIFKYYDWNSNYICVEHFDKVDRNFRCLVSVEVLYGVIVSCSEKIENIQNICEVLRYKSEFLKCSSDAVREKCGAEAATISNDLNRKGLEFAAEVNKDRCPVTNRARQLDMLKELLLRM